MIAVCVGPDVAMVRDTVRRIATARDPSGDSTTTLDGRAISFGEVVTSAASAGFFGAGRVVIVQDLLARFGKATAKDQVDWSGLFTAIPTENTLILADPSLASVPAAVKKALPPDAQIETGAPPRGDALVRWLGKQAQDAGSRLEPEHARLLATTLYPQTWAQQPNNPAFDRPPDLDALGNEVEKLALAAHPGPITRDHISTMVAAGDDDRIFRFIESASAGRLGDALVELERLLLAGEDPGKVFAQLAQNAELSLALASAGRRPPADVGRDLGLANANRLVAVARGLRDQPTGLSAHAARALTCADRRLKRGELRDPLAALYDAVLAIASARRTRVSRSID